MAGFEESFRLLVAELRLRLLLNVRVPAVATPPGLTIEPEAAVTLPLIVPKPAKVSALFKVRPPAKVESSVVPDAREMSVLLVIALAAPSTTLPALMTVTP